MLRSISVKNIGLSWVTAVFVFVSLHPLTGNGIAQVGQTDPDDVVFTRPTRRAPEVRPAAAPELPSGADHIKPLTFDLVVRREPLEGRAQVVRQTVSRTRDRIHIAVGGREWLFERNAIDPRRVSGQLIDHAKRSIVLHDESDLRNMRGLEGWADVLMLGLDAAVLSRLVPTDQTRTMAGIRFVKYAASDTDTRTSELWWSHEQAMPSAFVVHEDGAATRVSVERLSAGVNAEVLRSPSARFPEYKALDLAEWLEGH